MSECKVLIRIIAGPRYALTDKEKASHLYNDDEVPHIARDSYPYKILKFTGRKL